MKTIVIAVLALGLMAGVAFAGETGRGDYTSPIFEQWLDENPDFYHKHNYKQRSAIEAGVGLDVVLFEFGEEAKVAREISLELRKDFVDIERFAAYLVAKINVASVFSFLK